LKVIWVLENIEKNENFYSQLNILMLLASVTLWKRNHREDECIFYGDDITIDFLNKLKVLDLWDTIKPIPNPRKIDKGVFWASSKLQVLASIEDPVIIMDNDTHVYKPIKHLLDPNFIYVCNYEVGKGYYPMSADKYVRKLSYKTRWKSESVNVSFLQLPDPDFTRRYAQLSLQLMEEFTEMKVPNPQYLIFAEQLLLRHLLDKENIPYRSILSTDWDCKEWTWGNDHDQGLWTVKKSEEFFKHYGPLKSWIKDNKGNQNYDREILHLKNCISIPNLDYSVFKKR
jgi:hypothetical protein